MKTLIIEGIATSGKTTIIGMLENALIGSRKVKVIPEVDTIMVIEVNTSKQTSINHLKKLIDITYKSSDDIVIFDRLYLTHIFRTNGTIDDFMDIEEMLKQFSPINVYLKVDEKVIADRVKSAAGNRQPEWKQYIKTKGSDYHEIANYYISQQRNQLRLLTDSKIEYKIYDTTNHNYEEIVEDILYSII